MVLGSPLSEHVRGHVVKRIIGDDRARLLSKIARTAGDHWLWTGAKNGRGYGNFYLQGRYVGAHRAAYMLLVGPIPVGLEKCRNAAAERSRQRRIAREREQAA